MKSEQAAFGERLRAALKESGQSASPTELARLLARFGGTPVSAQAISGWLTGKSVPRQRNLRALARMLKVDQIALQYGDESGRKVREKSPVRKIDVLDQLAIDALLALPVTQRRLVRELIDQLAGAHAEPGKR